MTGDAVDIPNLLKRYNIRPDKRLGQNFLLDPVALQRVIQASNLKQDDSVLEVGAGVGNLTRLLATRCRRVVAVELDPRLIVPLEQVVGIYENVQVVQGDIMELEPSHLMEQAGYVVVANIPYYITSALIRHLLESEPQPRQMTMTVQREVAKRICAEPGEMSMLALSVQVYGKPSIEARIPAGAFYPVPKVESSIVTIHLYGTPLIPPPWLSTFFKLAKAGFSQKRKTLRNSLAGGLHFSRDETEHLLQDAGIDPMRRAETLSIQEWKNLTWGTINRESQEA